MIEKYGVLAYDIAADGDPRFLLITSRETKRWVIPRGNAVPGLPPAQSAAQAAFEEAGLPGMVGPEEIGAYRHRKGVVWGKGVSVRVDLGGRRTLKNKQIQIISL